MREDTAGGKQAMRRLEEVVREALDPGLRDSFADLPRAPITLVCCALDKGINHGNILRIAECFRLREVTFSPVGRRKEIDYSGGFAALRWQPHAWQEPLEAVREHKRRGERVYALTLGEGATPLADVRWQFPCAIVLGQELYGVDPEVLHHCDESVAIPLYGMVQSLNVAVSAGIAVNAAIEAYAKENPDFLPARAASRSLLATDLPDSR